MIPVRLHALKTRARRTIVYSVASFAVLASLTLPMFAQQEVDPTHHPMAEPSKPAPRPSAKAKPKKPAPGVRAQRKKSGTLSARLSREKNTAGGTK